MSDLNANDSFKKMQVLGALANLRNSPQESISKIEKLAEKGSVHGLVSLGIIYANGRVVAANPKLAEQYLFQAAALGSVEAHFVLGFLYQKQGLFEKAFLSYERAAEDGYPPAAFRLGRMHLFGVGTKKNSEKAYHWLFFSAEHGNIRSRVFLARRLCVDFRHPRNILRGLKMMMDNWRSVYATLKKERGENSLDLI